MRSARSSRAETQAPLARWPLLHARRLVWACALSIVLAFITIAPFDLAAQGGQMARATEAFERGRYVEVERVLGRAPADDTAAAVLRSRALIAMGQYQRAEELLRSVADRFPSGDAALELGLLLDLLGRREEAVGFLEDVLDGEEAASAGDYIRLGRAARAMRQFQAANSFFRQAASLSPRDPRVQVAWGELFLEKHNKLEAAKSFQAALAIEPENPAALVGLAWTVLDEQPPTAMASAIRALAVNPSFGDAHLVLATLALDNSRFDGATAAIAQALETNPRHLRALALRAAAAYLNDRQADFDAEVARVLEINPRFGEVFRVAGEHAARHYRFEEAAALAKSAIETDPDNVSAHADLGMHLFRLGEEDEARESLARAFSADPYDIVTYNVLNLLDKLESFDTFEDGLLVVRLHPDESEVLAGLVLPLAQEALTDLSSRYGFEPEGTVLVELFPEHDDFAVRSLGLPGLIGALGACFGRVVAMDSPRARPPGSFSWAATLWHEMAHVVTLQMSRQRVPRWLSEGISVFEEARARPEWGGGRDLPYAVALEQGERIPLRNLDGAFSDARTVSLAYTQASLLVEHIVEEHGESALRGMLLAYGNGLNTENVLSEVLDTDFDRLQQDFDRFIDERFGPLRSALRLPAGVNLQSASLDKLRELAEAHTGSFPVQMALGSASRNAGDVDGAIAAFSNAAALLPTANGVDSPRALLAELAIEAGDIDRAATELEELLAIEPVGLEAARRLAALRESAPVGSRLRVAYERIVEIDPFDAESHMLLGRLALEAGDLGRAAQAFRAALAAGITDRAAVHADLGESLLLSGDREQAKRHVIASLEVAPLYERAQGLLLKIVEEKRQ
jgi:cellulose synthase operon protein C